MLETSPLTGLEVAIREVKAGRMPVAEMLRVLFGSDLVLPSGAPVAADGAGLRPVVFDRSGWPAVACFTAMERMSGLDELAPFALHGPARAWLPRLTDGYGLAVNPAQPLGFEIDPDGLRRAIARLL